MRGGLDEALARMRRREEALRRRATESTGATDGPLGPTAGQVEDEGPSRIESRNAGPGWATARERTHEAPQRHVLDDAAEALRAVVAAYPGMTIAARIDHDSQAYDLRVTWSGAEVTVTGQPAAPPPSWPLSANTVPGWPASQDGLETDPAVRLAELIRRDPSLLTGEEPTG
ncbi:hypothetical protein Vqi01_32710 [Micromonospora qiuiae]|uniref:Uncharacterized protein n=1 Tax=Micromonospora qiuiae TaxID=502268 RepID=A0ABQ4JD65_9ACTN|nr:hypothetical protein [Micromonospora qiuiae]GIJ28109.1 hypothetical protein Vqi01_32710 [Micromonospora qiuiae]